VSQLLLFARHGNTFDPGDKVVWVGRESDLPLVAKGLEQAERLAAALRGRGWIPDAIYCASLRRTRRTAQIVAETLGLPAPAVDERLDELDYGGWAGRSNDEIVAADPAAAAAMAGWNQRDQWPENAGWGSRRGEIMAGLAGFAAECLGPARHARPLVVSSNGILRFLPRLLLAESERLPSFKMKTGHCGVIRRAGETASLAGWDLPPDSLSGISIEP
jgi:broad specificity phosphatase PhoE